VSYYTKIESGQRAWSSDSATVFLYQDARMDAGGLGSSYFNVMLKHALLECGFKELDELPLTYVLGKPPVGSPLLGGRVQVMTYNNLYRKKISVASEKGVEEVGDILQLFDLIRSHWL
jgi:hypothetical protein